MMRKVCVDMLHPKIVSNETIEQVASESFMQSTI